MMFSDVVGIANSLLSIPPNTLLPLLVLMIPAWFVGRLMRSLMESSHAFFLVLAGFLFYSIAASQGQQGKNGIAFFCAIPLVFIGNEVYRRLVR